MNDLQIMWYIAENPGTTAARIADKFDVELIDASNALRPLVEVGDLIRKNGFNPNGTPAQVYTVSDEFMKTTDGKAIAQRLTEVAEKRTAAAEPAPVPFASPAATSAPAVANDLPPTLVQQLSKPGRIEAGAIPASRPERAIAFIRANGGANDAQLRELLGMTHDQYPSDILRSAVNNGRVKRVGSDWVIGDGKAPAPLRRQPAFGVPLGLPGARPHKKEEKPPVEEKAPAPAPVHEPAAASERSILRGARWSDGIVELQRDGKTIHTLQRDEVQFLTNFLTGAPV
ncbi:MAG: winged helix-turn-helix transcriptional regulator [Burkholderiales bacterium]|nr:winged helix-turn-helix transcriptional regulator [Burkholderiales bacterium]